MRYARRSVSDQDIRRYEMFAQVEYHPLCSYRQKLMFFAESTAISLFRDKFQVPRGRSFPGTS